MLIGLTANRHPDGNTQSRNAKKAIDRDAATPNAVRFRSVMMTALSFV